MMLKIVNLLFLLVTLTVAQDVYSNTTVANTEQRAGVTTLAPSFSIVPSVTVNSYADDTTTFFVTSTVYNTIWYTVTSVANTIADAYTSTASTTPVAAVAAAAAMSSSPVTASTVANALTTSQAVTTTQDDMYTSTTVTSTMKVTVTLDASEAENLNKELMGEFNTLNSGSSSYLYYGNNTSSNNDCVPVTEYVTITAEPITNYITVTPEPVTQYITLNSTDVYASNSTNITSSDF